MPKMYNLKKDRIADLKRRFEALLDPDHMMWKQDPGAILDDHTLKHVQAKYALWFRSWQQDDLNKYLK